MAETLHPKDHRFLLAAVAVSALSLWIGVRYFYRAFPEASIDFQFTRESSRPPAERFLQAQGVPIDGYRHAARFQFDEEAKVFLERELGLERANALMGRELRLWRWVHRWYRPLQKEEIQVQVTTRGEIAAFSHTLPEDAPGAELGSDVARSIAESFLGIEMDRPIDSLEFLDSHSQKRPHRADHVFTWKLADQEYRGATYRVSVTVQGDRVDGYSEFVKVPEEWSRGYARLRSLNETTTVVDSLLFVLLGIGIVVTLGRRIRMRDVQWRTALAFGGVSALLQLLAALNAFPLAEFGFDTTSSYGSFVGRTTLQAVLSALGFGGIIFVLTAGCEPLYRAAFPEHLSIARMFTWQGIRTRGFLIASAAGIALTFFFVAYVIGFYLVATKLGAWAPAEVPYTELLNTRFPWVFVLFGGFFPAVSEEWVFRIFAIPFLASLTRRRWLAVVAASFIWGFGHANYPNQPFFIRGVEVGIAGLVFSWAMMRFGILAPLVAHYSIDAFFTAFLFLRSGNPYLVASGAVTAGINLIPLLVAAGAYVATRGFRSEAGVRNADLSQAPAAEEREPEAAQALPGYAPLGRRATYGALALLAVASFALFFSPPRFGSFARFRAGASAAEHAAGRFLEELGHGVSSMRRATQPLARVDPLAAQYLYAEDGIAGLNLVFGDPRHVPGLVWETRFFQPLQKEEYRVAVDPTRTEVVAFRRLLPEQAPGADLPQEAALAKTTAFLRGRGYDLERYDLVETHSEKPLKRRDTEFLWEAKKGTPAAIGEARLRLKAGVLGDEIGTWTSEVKLPEQWRRERVSHNVYSITVIAVRMLFIISMVGLAIMIVVRGTRQGSVRWRTTLAVAGAAAAVEAANLMNSFPEYLFGYDTQIDYRVFAVNGIVISVMFVLGMALAAALAVACVLACFSDAGVVLQRDARRAWGRDAVLASAAALGALGLLQWLSSQVQYGASHLALAPDVSLPRNLGSWLPLVSCLRDVLMTALFYSTVLALAVHLWTRMALARWQRAVLASALVVSLMPPEARRFTEAALDVVPSLAMVALAAWLVARYFRNNYLAYPLSAAVLASVRGAVSLQGHGNAALEVQAWLLVALALAALALCWRTGPRVAA